MPPRMARRTTMGGHRWRRWLILGSEPAPAAGDLGVELDALFEAIEAAVLVGLVHEFQLAGTEDHGRWTAVGGRQRGGIGEVRDATQGRARTDDRGGELEDLLDPGMPGIRPEGLDVDDRLQRDVAAQILGQTLHEGAVLLVGNGADVDADGGRIGYRVDVEAPGDRADVEGRRPEHRMWWRLEAEVLELGHRVRRLVDGVDAALGHRSVGGDAAGPRVEPERALVTDAGVEARRLADDYGARFAERAGRGSEVSRAVAAGLLPGDDHEHKARRPRKPLCQTARGNDECGDAALHVGRAAPVEATVGGLACERIARPGRRAERHRVDVASEAEGRPLGRAAEASDQARPTGGIFVGANGEAGVLQHAAKAFRTRALVARRVDGVDAEQLAREVEGFHVVPAS